MQTTPANADDPQFGTSTKFGRYLGNATYEGDAEIGGYVPLRKLKDHLFYFGNFNPSVNHQYMAPAITSNLFSLVQRPVAKIKDVLRLRRQVDFKRSMTGTRWNPLFSATPRTPTMSVVHAECRRTKPSIEVGLWHAQLGVRYDGALTNTWLMMVPSPGVGTLYRDAARGRHANVDNTQTAGLAKQAGSFNAQGFGFLEPYDAIPKASLLTPQRPSTSWGSKHSVSAIPAIP